MKKIQAIWLLLVFLISIVSCKQSDCAIEVTIHREALPQQQYRYTADVTGGAEPITYAWSNGSTEASITTPIQTKYEVTVTDLSNCTAQDIFNDPVLCDPFVDDANGNQYHVVSINGKCWMAENLKVTLGSAVDSLGWVAAGMAHMPAWCYPNNNVINYNLHGELYNWYAVNKGNLCPGGWHIPSAEEWNELITFLGGDQAAGGALKSTNAVAWADPNTGATNSSGFGATGAGDRSNQGLFESFLHAGIYWTSTLTSDTNKASTIIIFNSATSALTSSQVRAHGYSCRCVHD